MKRISLILLLSLFFMLGAESHPVTVITDPQAGARERYAAEYLQKKLKNLGYQVFICSGKRINPVIGFFYMISLTNRISGPE